MCFIIIIIIIVVFMVLYGKDLKIHQFLFYFNGMKNSYFFSNWIIEIRTNYMALYFFYFIIILF